VTEGDGSPDSGDGTDTNRTTGLNTHSYSSRIGVYEGWPVHIAISQAPANAPVPDRFGVNLFVPDAEGENVDIARIDTAHAGCHIDRLYLPVDHPERTEDYTIQCDTPREAYEHFVEDGRWRYYVERYDQNHGLPPETRVY